MFRLQRTWIWWLAYKDNSATFKAYRVYLVFKDHTFQSNIHTLWSPVSQKAMECLCMIWPGTTLKAEHQAHLFVQVLHLYHYQPCLAVLELCYRSYHLESHCTIKSPIPGHKAAQLREWRLRTANFILPTTAITKERLVPWTSSMD